VAAPEGKSVPARFSQLSLPAVTSRHIVAVCLADMGAFAEGIAVAEEGVQMAEAVESGARPRKNAARLGSRCCPPAIPRCGAYSRTQRGPPSMGTRSGRAVGCLRGDPEQTKPQGAVAVACLDSATIRRTALLGITVPAATAPQPV
jgi:hypothetical protein